MRNLGMKKYLLLASKSQRKNLGGRWRENFRRMKRLKSEMEEINKQQESIRKGQREVKESFEMVMSEFEQLRRDADLIARQSVETKVRLFLMFQILKARHNNRSSEAAALTQLLREVIAKQCKNLLPQN